MYAKYSTDALVLGSVPHGEADKRFTLYTREFGLIRARASAVRRESSRMRYALQTLTRAQVSLISGKTGWRVAGAYARVSLSGAQKEAIESFSRATRLLVRLVHGEEKNEQLFTLLARAQEAFAAAAREDVPILELLCVARILHALGYLSSDALGTVLVTEALFDSATLSKTREEKVGMLASVNRALTETHL